MKAETKIYKGIEYVQVNQLPAEQQNIISETLSNKLYIKILIDGKIIGNCLQYKDYELWYNNVYRLPHKRSGVLVIEEEFEASLKD
jgi:hypothetical protein